EGLVVAEFVMGDGEEAPRVAEELSEDEEDSWSSESEVGEALDWLDLRDGPDGEGVSASFSLASSHRPNAHGGLLSRPLQPISNRNQKYSSHIRANPLEEWEGRTDVGMSNSVTTAIRDSVRDMAIGRTRNTEKADRATVEQLGTLVYHVSVCSVQLGIAPYVSYRQLINMPVRFEIANLGVE
ncbi:hypothetical protein BHE74_00034041, partial [Ensete ventricosum]